MCYWMNILKCIGIVRLFVLVIKIKESIFVYLKEYFYLINLVSYFDVIIEIYSRKGFYYIFSYKEDVLKVLKDLKNINMFFIVLN